MAFNEIELDIAKEIVSIGLGKAADSLSFFTKESVMVENLDVKMQSIEDLGGRFVKEHDPMLYILTTHVKGDMKGVCFLILRENEVRKLYNVSLPASVLESPEKLQVMGDAILLEMDNIVVASVVTQFSNLFNIKIFGDVPGLYKCPQASLIEFIKDQSIGFASAISFSNQFVTTSVKINPVFVWFLDDEYMNGVKRVSANDEVLQKIRKG